MLKIGAIVVDVSCSVYNIGNFVVIEKKIDEWFFVVVVLYTTRCIIGNR